MNRPQGWAEKDRLLMLSYMPERFSVTDFANIHCITYVQAANHVRAMVECNMLRKGGTRMARIYTKI